MGNINGVEIRNPITLELYGNMDFEEEVPKYTKNSRMPMPESYKEYIDKNNNKRVF